MKYHVRKEGTLLVEADSEEEAIEIAEEKSVTDWSWNRATTDEED